MKAEQQLREPTVRERELLNRLLEAEFPGRDELERLLGQVYVRTIAEGYLELRSQVSGNAPVVKRIPVEGEARDADGMIIHLLLHVIEGRPVELEMYKDDGSSILRLPSPQLRHHPRACEACSKGYSQKKIRHSALS